MSNINDYFLNLEMENIFEITIGENKFFIRSLDGIDILQLCDISSLDGRIVQLLATSLLNHQNSKPIGNKNAEHLVRERPSTAVLLALAILNVSEKLDLQEEVLIKEIKKNG